MIGCSQDIAPAVIPTVAVPTIVVEATLLPTKSAIVGQLLTQKGGSPAILPRMGMRLAQVVWNEQRTDGSFILDSAGSPLATSKDDGSFSFLNIEPADYVIVVGDAFGTYERYLPGPTARRRSTPLNWGRLRMLVKWW